MKLKAIELAGFKSFGKKSKLDFTVPVTGIVGPNGSGKSNVVEAFRFVLGEQSMKSLRGKTGRDLIFKGSKDLGKGNRASVSITFDNRDRKLRLEGGGAELSLDFDEIVLRREVFADGANTYSINGTTVRLKDIVDLLASANIGSSGHHIISQGQADRILSSTPKDRRGMVEDALGLKVYQHRLKDAGKKLDKTAENIKEVAVMRRELAPHIKYLHKQVEKIEKSAAVREELAALYRAYFAAESAYLANESSTLSRASGDAERELKEIEVKLAAMKSSPSVVAQTNDHEALVRKELAALERTKEELSRKLGRIEGMIEIGESRAADSGSVSIASADIESLVSEITSIVDGSTESDDLSSIRAELIRIKSIIYTFGEKFKRRDVAPATTVKDLETTRRDVAAQLEEIERVRAGLVDKLATLDRAKDDARAAQFKDQEERFTLETRKNALSADIAIARERAKNFEARKADFENETREAVTLVGRDILEYANGTAPLANHEESRRTIERLKIRLEDLGTGSGDDVMKEYREVTERDAFLVRELEDLEKSMANVRLLMDELKETLEREFQEGMRKINQRFEEFFKQMFGGGSAYLSAVVQPAKDNNRSDEDEEVDDMLADETLDYGIDIHVTLPHKKVKDLHMLSGGERSLTSIALVFAMTQVNPPPFLVLDETDAALDEANSKRYGDMIATLAGYSQLIIVTHNRETMSRADVIYGVTVGADGASKLLSIRFEEAESYAK